MRRSTYSGEQRNFLSLLGGFELRVQGRIVVVPVAVQRLLALLVIKGRAQHRSTVATTLWLDTSEDHAARNLRTTLWRARKLDEDLVEANGSYLTVHQALNVDVDSAVRRAAQLLEPVTSLDENSAAVSDFAGINVLGGELLPDWPEDWVMIERERLRQLRMHALEALCERLTAARRYAHAVEAGLAAVAMEPLRESADRVLIETYLREGNLCEALRHYDGYRELLHEELGVKPSSALTNLIELGQLACR